MSSELTVSSWAQATFGERVHQVRQGVVEALQIALNDAQNAQQISRASTRHTFGAALMTRKYEALANILGDMDEVRIVRPAGSPFKLAVIGSNLLLPFRYAQDATVPIGEARISDRQVSDRMRTLFSRFGPQPEYVQGSLLADESAEDDELAVLGPALADLPADTRLVLVAFACNDQAGLINAWWGEAELFSESGELRWIRPPEELPVPAEQPAGLHPELVRSPAAQDVPAARFDAGEMPGLATQPRSPLPLQADAPVQPDGDMSPGPARAGSDGQL